MSPFSKGKIAGTIDIITHDNIKYTVDGHAMFDE